MVRRGYRRSNRVVIGPNSQNLGRHNILTSRRRLDDTPQLVMLVANIQPDGTWNLTVTWQAPNDAGITPTGYEIERIQIQDPIVPYGSAQTVVPLTADYINVPEGIYQARVRTLHLGGPSDWVVSNRANAFINLSFNWQGSPSFHTLQA